MKALFDPTNSKIYHLNKKNLAQKFVNPKISFKLVPINSF